MNEKLVSQFRMRAAALAVASCVSLAPGLAEAASLGRITVLSNLGQPLRAEVQLGATRDELAGMTASLAPGDSFRQAGVHYAPILQDLRFTLGKGPDGSPLVRITSSRPVNDTFLDFLLELSWPSGRLVREYTVLLDPPEISAKGDGKPVSVAEARPEEAAREGGTPEPAEPGEAAGPAQAVKEAGAEAGKAGTAQRSGRSKSASSTAEQGDKASTGKRRVKRGDTLRGIAEETRYEGVSLEQMLVGLYRNNSNAFMGRNINRMKAGAILDLPDPEAVADIPQAEARKVFRAHANDWNAYRRNLAAAAAQGPAREEASSQSAGGRITARVDEKLPPAEGQKDQVRVSRAEAASKGPSGDGALARAEENLIAKDKALQEAQERLVILEKNVADLQKLLELKNQSLAELQKQATDKSEQPAPTAPAVPGAPVAAALATVPPQAADQPPAVPDKPADAPAAAAPEKPAEAPTAVPEPTKPAHRVLEDEEPETSFVEDLAASPLTLAGAGGILALLAAFIIHRRRRAEPAPLPLTPATITEPAIAPDVPDGGGAPLHTDFSQTGPGTIDTGEVDPVAEAEVYMAYGRDAQAEEILREALQKDPGRTAIHVKLLEILSRRGDVPQFDSLARELHARTGGQGGDWNRAAAMGLQLNPANPLYAAAGAAMAAGKAGATPAAYEPVLEDVEPARSPAPLDFDLAALAPAEPAARPTPAAEESAPDNRFNFDFNLNLDTPAGSLRPEAGTGPASSRPPPKPSELPAATASEPESDQDLSLEEALAEVPSLDLASIDLELAGEGTKEAAPEKPAAPPAEAAPPEPAHDAAWEEVNTKLDLAKAYEEMGDLEGARELLQEVLGEGSEDLVQEARGILDRLNA